MTPRRRRWPYVAALVIGVGLALAPAAFQMFTRAPKGGDMLDGFAPYMTEARIASFEADLTTIGAARDEVVALAQADPSSAAATAPGAVAFAQQWPAIDADMRSMLATMRANIGHYDGVAALPPFPLFPWFFVIPGVLLAGFATWGLTSTTDRGVRRSSVAIAALGVGLLLAPVAFQMFTRAPGGAAMIDDFRPFMTRAKVLQIQGYFLTIGGGEGDLRLRVLPEVHASGDAVSTTAIANLGADWPTVSADMAPMIGAMVDNIENYEAVAALPPFGLFPWFFVVPGLAAITLAAASLAPVLQQRDERNPTMAATLQTGLS